VEEVPAKHSQSELSSLSDLDEVIHEHIRDSHRSLERAVGRTVRGDVTLTGLYGREVLEGARGGVVFLASRERLCGKVVEFFGRGFEAMRFAVARSLLEP
jgi:hypothetical protein